MGEKFPQEFGEYRLLKKIAQGGMAEIFLAQDKAGEIFALKPAEMIRDLNVLRPIFRQTAAYGHFGREEPDFTWERTDKADALRKLF